MWPPAATDAAPPAEADAACLVAVEERPKAPPLQTSSAPPAPGGGGRRLVRRESEAPAPLELEEFEWELHRCYEGDGGCDGDKKGRLPLSSQF